MHNLHRRIFLVLGALALQGPAGAAEAWDARAVFGARA